MATTEQELLTVLEADAAVQTHFGATPETRIFPTVLPQKPTLPAATYQRIAGAPVNSFDGLNPLDNGLYQVDVYAATKQASREAADAIRDAIDDAAGLGAVLLDVRSAYEADTEPRLYRVSMDFSLWVDES